MRNNSGGMPGEIPSRKEEDVDQRYTSEYDKSGLSGTTAQRQHERQSDQADVRQDRPDIGRLVVEIARCSIPILSPGAGR